MDSATDAFLATAQPARHPTPTARARSLAYLMFERPDLDRAERFLNDFGLRTAERTHDLLYLRGTGSAPWCYRIARGGTARFVGMGFTVADPAELDALAALPGASTASELDAPGSGVHVRLADPNGFRVDAVHGQTPAEAIPHRRPLPANHDAVMARVNDTQRPPVAPPEIIKLGHVVLDTPDYQATCAWYTRHLGLIPSDVQVLPDGSPVVTFFRLDRGDEPADHHTLALALGINAGYSHSAYELVDVDAIGMGQRVLRDNGWRHAWGIGRHILGSQIFDYWSDPWGCHHEHYCDGDVFTADVPLGIHAFSGAAMAQWGQKMPASFVRPKLTPANVLALLRHLRRSPDLSVQRLVSLARLVG